MLLTETSVEYTLIGIILMNPTLKKGITFFFLFH